MDEIYENIRAGKYDNKLPYPDRNAYARAPKLNSNMPTVEETKAYLVALDNWQNNKDSYAGKVAEFNKEDTRLRLLFESDMANEFGLVNHPKRALLWEKAWDQGHHLGQGQVYESYKDLAELLVP